MTRIEVPAGAAREEVLALVHRNRQVQERIGPGEIEKEIYVPGQIVNIVTSAR